MSTQGEGQGNPTEPADTPHPPIVLDHVRATDGIRTSAKWVMAAAAAVAAIVVAGLQLKEISQIRGRLSQVLAALLALTILGTVGFILQRAARILVCTPMTLSRLVDIERDYVNQRAAQQNKPQRTPLSFLHRKKREPHIYSYVEDRGEVLAALGIDSVLNLYHLYRGEGLGVVNPPPPRDRIESAAEQLVTFVELRQAEYRYDLLVKALAWAGALFALCLIALIFLVGAPKSPSDPRVIEPIPVRVRLTGGQQELTMGGFSGCSGTYDGTAVSGSFRQPVVLLTPKDATPSCHPPAREITPSLGVVIYPHSPQYRHPPSPDEMRHTAMPHRDH
ncbi:hypothetical protein ACIBW9_01015 [Streptomyces sp. NPDC049541]|uniref:hypothetical protein n=1 Tax=Streptomyces sp. NPDC049541 TaxID=3365594 RepID=UPI003792E9A3